MKSLIQRGLKIEVARSAEVRETSVDVPQFPTKHGQSRVRAAAVAPGPRGTVPCSCVPVEVCTQTDVPIHWLLKCIKAQLKEKVFQGFFFLTRQTDTFM